MEALHLAFFIQFDYMTTKEVYCFTFLQFKLQYAQVIVDKVTIHKLRDDI